MYLYKPYFDKKKTYQGRRNRVSWRGNLPFTFWQKQKKTFIFKTKRIQGSCLQSMICRWWFLINWQGQWASSLPFARCYTVVKIFEIWTTVLDSPTRGKDIRQCKSLRSLHLSSKGLWLQLVFWIFRPSYIPAYFNILAHFTSTFCTSDIYYVLILQPEKYRKPLCPVDIR